MIINSKEIIKLINEKVKLGEILRQEGIITYQLNEEQYSCKFHGNDIKKSARYYKDTDTAYCWVCKEIWDTFSYIKKKKGLSFSETIKYFIDTYKLNISILNKKDISLPDYKKNFSINNKKIKIEKLKATIKDLKNKIDWDRYIKVVYLYMLLKYAVSEDKFEDNYKKLIDKMIKIFKK